MAGESLRVIAGQASGAEIPLEGDLLIGRAADVEEGKLGDDPEISRRHARITLRAGDQLAIEDLGSTNGTFVNGKRIEASQTLIPGDTIKVGMTTLQVLDASGNAPQATAFAAIPPEGGTEPEPEPEPDEMTAETKAAPTPPPQSPAPPASPGGQQAPPPPATAPPPSPQGPGAPGQPPPPAPGAAPLPRAAGAPGPGGPAPARKKQGLGPGSIVLILIGLLVLLGAIVIAVLLLVG